MKMDSTLVWDQEEALKDIRYTVDLFWPVFTGEKRIKVIALMCYDGTEFIGDTTEWISIKKAKGVATMLLKSLLGIGYENSDFGADI
jgi:hypothetical protein